MLAAVVGSLAVAISKCQAATESVPDFELDVMAVLSRSGCNQGTCHGNQNGKGGFFLSLRGQDPNADHLALTEEWAGRRINRVEPRKSLLLAKATAETPHRGGQRFSPDSTEYRTLAAWIKAGAPYQKQREQLISISATPQQVVMEPGERVTINAIAHFANGESRPINDLAVFSSTQLSIEVTSEGEVVADRVGESNILVRYLDQQIAIDVAIVPKEPSESDVSANSPQQESPSNPIDVWVAQKLNRLRLTPSERCSDTVFLRRAYLDALGRLPTETEAKRFASDDRAEKRVRLVDELLARPEFATLWALKWSDVLRNEEKVLDKEGVTRFHEWIRNSVIESKPIDQFARELVASRGSTYEHPPANYYRALRDPMTRGEATARLFLGVRLQCAKCHNHPFEKWTQDDYYEWSAVFARVDYEIVENNRRDKLDKHEFAGEQVVKIVDEGDVKNPRTDQIVAPRFLGDASEIDESERDRLMQLADWLTVSQEERFARVQANFIWYQTMGQGIVEPVDDFRVTNPASNPALLDWLTDELINSRFDLHHLVRLIMTSDAYQRSSVPTVDNRHDQRNYAYAVVRRLAAEPLLDAQNQVLGTRSQFALYPDLVRAVELPGAYAKSPKEGDRFLLQFGKPTRLLGCECERAADTTLSQVFELVSGQGLNKRLEERENEFHVGLRAGRSVSQLVDELFWRSLSRAPTADELEGALRLVESAPSPAAGLQDIAWSLLNSKEFIFRR